MLRIWGLPRNLPKPSSYRPTFSIQALGFRGVQGLGAQKPPQASFFIFVHTKPKRTFRECLHYASKGGRVNPYKPYSKPGVQPHNSCISHHALAGSGAAFAPAESEPWLRVLFCYLGSPVVKCPFALFIQGSRYESEYQEKDTFFPL